MRKTRRVTRSGGCGIPELSPQHPACTGGGERRRRRRGGKKGGGRAGQALHGPRESPRRLPSCPRRFLSATAAAASTPSSGHRCPPQRREHRGRCRGQRPLTSYSAAGSGRSAAGHDEGTRSRSGKDGEGGRRSQPALAPAPAPAPAGDREPLPAPSASPAARPPNGTAQPRRRPRRAGVVGARAHWVPPRHQRELHWPLALPLVPPSQ